MFLNSHLYIVTLKKWFFIFSIYIFYMVTWQFKFRQFKFLKKYLRDYISKRNEYFKKISNTYVGFINIYKPVFSKIIFAIRKNYLIFYKTKKTFSLISNLRSFLTRSYLTWSFLTQSFLTRSLLTRSFLTRSFLIRSLLTRLYLTRSLLTRPLLTRSFLTRSFLTRSLLNRLYLTRSLFTRSLLTRSLLTRWLLIDYF